MVGHLPGHRLLEECIKVARITVLQYILGSGIASVILLLSNCKVFVTHLKILQYFFHYFGLKIPIDLMTVELNKKQWNHRPKISVANF